MAKFAVQAIKKMRGGAQSQLMLDTEGVLWVVKFQNNPQHLRVLANEFIATRLAEAIGLSVPECAVVEVSSELMHLSPEMSITLGQGRYQDYSSGLQFGSRYVAGLVIDYLPATELSAVRNLEEFAGVLCLDKWLGNADGRQAVFSRKLKNKQFSVSFIDQGFCFNVGEWNFPDSPLRGVYGRNLVYKKVTGWKSFEPWLTRIESITSQKIAEITECVPLEWYNNDAKGIQELSVRIFNRRLRVRELVEEFRRSCRKPFPNWV